MMHPIEAHKRALYLCLAFCLAVLATLTHAGDTPPEPPVADEEPVLAELAAVFRKHCVKVFIHGKSHDGKSPTNATFATNIHNERPTLIGGYWWDDRHVIIEDPVVQDQFIRQVEVGLPYSDMRYPAKIVGRFVWLQAVLVEVLPGEGDVMPQAFPLRFEDGDPEEAIIMNYSWANGEWGIAANAGLGGAFVGDGGVETVEFKTRGVIMDEKGAPVGLAFGGRVILDEDLLYWAGRDLSYTRLYDIDDAEASQKKLGEKLAEAVLETRFRFRIKIEDDDEAFPDWTIDLGDESPLRSGGAEIRAAALVVGTNHLLVPLSLPAEGIARIEEITVITTDGREIPAQFIGAFRDYMAVFIQTEEALTTKNLPDGFRLLNPLVVPEEAFRPEKDAPKQPVLQYIQRWRIDYGLGRRRQVVDYDRWRGIMRGYRDDEIIHTFTNEEEGSLAFDVDDNLVAVALAPRILNQNRDAVRYGAQNNATAGFRPLEFLRSRLNDTDTFDPAMRPTREVDGQRLVDFGVEFQGLDENTSRLFLASNETRGGRIGLLVTHVYPESIAGELGIQEHDILLRLFVEGKNEPMELRGVGYGGRGYMDVTDLSAQSFSSVVQFMPPPWPSREDVLSTLLTAAGVGKNVTVEFMREGEPMRASFITRYTAPDYRNAPKERFPALGLTVKPVTYEVQRYLRKSDASGVMVSKVEEGGKSAVAGLHHYLLVTHVNGQPVKDVDDFKDKVKGFEDGRTTGIELTVEGFGKTRLVKIE